MIPGIEESLPAQAGAAATDPGASIHDEAIDLVSSARSLQSRYTRINRSVRKAGGPDGGAYCRQILKQLEKQNIHDLERVLAEARNRHPTLPLPHVLSAQHFLGKRQFGAAVEHARTAVALDQLDLHAQRLLQAAEQRRTHLHSEVDTWLKGRFCPRPFESLETRVNGSVSTCCAAWMPAPIGHLDTASPDQIWNSSEAREVRRSVLDGDFSYCSRMYCQKIANRELPERDRLSDPVHRSILARRQTVVKRGPVEVVLGHDRSCNLSCPSCRVSIIVERKSKQDKMNRLADVVLLPLLRDANQVKVTGSGDPFASGHFRYVIQKLGQKEFANVRLQIQTNGLLFDEKAWNDLRLEGRISSIWVSIDAGRKQTYELVRRGGTFEKLIDNLLFLSGLRRSGRFGFFRLDTVVQWLNYRELPEIVLLGRLLGVDRVSFQMLRNWGTYSVQEFDRHNIGDPRHPEFEAFLQVLRHPRLVWPEVSLSTLRPFVELAQGGKCEASGGPGCEGAVLDDGLRLGR